jgi:hypothetical protein
MTIKADLRTKWLILKNNIDQMKTALRAILLFIYIFSFLNPDFAQSQDYTSAILITPDRIIQGDSISRKDLLSVIQLGVVYASNKRVKGALVSQYELLIIDQADSIELAAVDGRISKVMREKFVTLRPGSKIIFQGIRIVGIDGTYRHVPLLKVTLID